MSLLIFLEFETKGSMYLYGIYTLALNGLPYHIFEVYVYTMKLHGAFGEAAACSLGVAR